MSRAISLDLEITGYGGATATLETYAYDRDTVDHDAMAERVHLALEAGFVRAMTRLTPDQARVLANQLLSVADTCDEAIQRRVSFEEIREQMDRATEDGREDCVIYVHPDVHYVATEEEAAAVLKGKRVGIALVRPDMAAVA